LVRLGVRQLVPGVPQSHQHLLQLREDPVRLFAREVAAVNKLGALLAHALAVAFGAFAGSRSRSRAASEAPIVRSWPWKARCQWSGGHFRTCSSSVASSSAGTKSSSARTTAGSASTRQG